MARLDIGIEFLESRTMLSTWYVATNGLDGAGRGTAIDQPLLTIQAAADRALPGDTVYVRAGTYREEVRPLNNGTAAAPITYMPYNGESVVITGTNRISTGWTVVAGTNTYYTSFPGVYTSAVNNSEQVFVNGQMVNLARWPDQGNSDLSHPNQATVDSILSSTATGRQAWSGGYAINRIVFTDASFTDTSNLWVGAKIWMNNGNAQNSGVDETQDGDGVTGDVVAVDGATHTITVDIGASAATGTAQPGNFKIGLGSKYYFFDPTSLPSSGISYGGQWWHDRRGTTDPSDDRLYLRTFDGSSPAASTVEVKLRDWAFNFDTGTGTTDNGRSYITVKDFNIFGASITTDHLAGNGAQGPDGGNLRGITTAKANHLTIDGLKLQYVSHFTNQAGDLQAQWAQSSGVILSGSDNTFSNGEIAWSAGSGIIAIGARNKVQNSKVHDTNYNVTEGGAIGLGSNRKGAGPSVDSEIAYNEVYNAGVDGIQFDGLKNSTNNKNDIRARIHHNVVHDTVLQSADSGAIKMFGADGNWVRIDHNIVYNTGGTQTTTKYLFFGIYLDYTGTAGGYVIDHNLVYATPIGINLNNNSNVEVYNNTLMQPSTVGRHSIGNDAGGAMDGVIIRNNLANRTGRGLSGTGVNAVLSNNVFNAAESTTWFTDPLNASLLLRNYTLVSNATTTASTGAIDRGVSVSPFNDTLVGLPDLGAYEYGATRWTAGTGQAISTSWRLEGSIYRDGNRNSLRDASEAGLSGRTVYLDQNNNGLLDGSTTSTYTSSGAAVAIPDASATGATRSVTVPAGLGTIAKLTLSFAITHTWDSDLVGYLIAPNGTTVTLFQHVGAEGDNFITTTLDDLAAISIDTSTAPFNGTFKPSGGALSTFAGLSAAGTWSLKVVDDAASDVGTLNSFSLSLTTAAELNTTTGSDGSYVFNNLGAGTYALRQVVPTGWSAVSPAGARSVTVTEGTTLSNQDFGTYENSTPTVATAAATNPGPTSGFNTALSVLGADANGEANLIYTWSVVGTPPAAVTFGANGTNAAKNSTATFTQAGTYNLRVTITNAGGTSVTSNVSVNVINSTPPSLVSFSVNSGATQRSMVTKLTVKFDKAVTLSTGALVLSLYPSVNGAGTKGALPGTINWTTSDGGVTYNAAFSGTNVIGGSLADGGYKLTINGTLVKDGIGQSLATGNSSYSFFRLFGDLNGSGTTSNNDYTNFKKTFGLSTGAANFNAAFDYDNNGTVNNADQLQFKKRLNTSIVLN